MKRWIIFAILAVSAAGSGHAATFEGEIADSSCALNVHSLSRSHKEMLKSRSFGPDAAACARQCVAKFGSSFVLSKQRNVYRLDNQVEAEKWAGQAVIVTGELDTKTNVIAVKSIEPAHK